MRSRTSRRSRQNRRTNSLALSSSSTLRTRRRWETVGGRRLHRVRWGRRGRHDRSEDRRRGGGSSGEAELRWAKSCEYSLLLSRKRADAEHRINGYTAKSAPPPVASTSKYNFDNLPPLPPLPQLGAHASGSGAGSSQHTADRAEDAAQGPAPIPSYLDPALAFL